MEASSRRYAHGEGITHLCYDAKRRLVTCGHDCDVRLFAGIEDDDCSDFSVASDKISALACYQRNGKDLVAIATDDNTVQVYTSEGSPEGLLLRFTAPVNFLAVNGNHSLLAAGSSEFCIKVVDLGDPAKVVTLRGHEAPVLCVNFDPKGREFLASSCCDGTVKIWSLQTNECVKTLPLLQKSNDVSLAKSLCHLAWHPQNGKVLAIPVGSEVKLYDRTSWKCVSTFTDDHHKENINVVAWSPCGQYIASGGVDGHVTVWDASSRKAHQKYKNDNGIGITSLEWDPKGRGKGGDLLAFADNEGYVGVFEKVYPGGEGGGEVAGGEKDPLEDDSLLMEGIPADDIFNDDYNIEDDMMDVMTGGYHDNQADGEREGEDDDDIVQFRKRRRVEEDESDGVTGGEQADIGDDDIQSVLSEGRQVLPQQPGQRRVPPSFSERLLEVYQKPFQPSGTPEHLQHRFMLYNLVGMVRSHGDEEASMVEVEFHNTSTHHTFSMANPLGFSMAALNEQAVVLACERSEDVSSQLQCIHFSSWDGNKDWTVTLPSKESIQSLTIGNGWIAIATNRQVLRLLTVGGVQREVVSLPGMPVTLAGWGGRLAVVYQTAPCTENVFGLTVWVLDVRQRRQLHPPHILPLSHKAKLEWIGFSEEGVLVSYDTKGMVRVLTPSLYGGLSWIPVLDTTKQVGNKSDHYFIVGMTHNPHELRSILCKGLSYPPVHPKPVMSTLSLKLPLCEMNTEKAEIEDKYLQLELLRTSSQESDAGKMQQLMKLFALACKSDREFRACEIAGLMLDEHSMNLALTYASRTQHVRLARHISDLIQQRSLEGLDSGDEELYQGDYYETEAINPANQNAEEDVEYARNRTETLRQRPGALVKKRPVPTSSRLTGSKTLAKFDHYMDEIRQGRFLSLTSTSKRLKNDSQEGYHGNDETKELFSDQDSEDGGDGGTLNGEPAAVEDLETESVGSDVRMGTPPLLQALERSSSNKRPNPFKMATPVSKKVQVDRRTSFLDNITAKVDEEQRRKEKREANRGRGGKGSRKSSKPAVSRKAPGVQSNLKSSFFKKKEVKDEEEEKQGREKEGKEKEGEEKEEEEKEGEEKEGEEMQEERQRGGKHGGEKEGEEKEEEIGDRKLNGREELEKGEVSQKDEASMREEVGGKRLSGKEKLASYAFNQNQDSR